MSSISDLLIAQGNAQANARSQRGNIYADLIRNLSSLPGQVIQQQRATQQDALRQQALNQQLELGKGEQDLQRQRLTMAQSEAQDKQKATARQTSIDAILGADVYGEDGDVDIDKVRTLAAKQDPSIVPHAVAVAQQLNKQTNEYRKSQADYEQAQLALAGRRNDAIGMAGLELMAPGEVDEGSYQLAIGQFVKHKLVDPQQAEAWLSASTPAERKANVASMIRGSKEATAMLPKPTPPKLMQQDPTKNVIDENTQKIVIPAVAAGPDPKDAETARHNQAMESIGRMTAGRQAAAQTETARHNKAMEDKATTGKPPTGAQSKALSYYNRAKEASDTLTEGGETSLEQRMAKANIASQLQLKSNVNMLQTAEQQQYRQAQRAFTEARLRKESGAQVPDKEYANDARTYFAQPGDDPSTIKQKERARKAVLEGLKFEAGPAFEAFYGEPNVPAPRDKSKTGTVGKYTFTVVE